MFRSLHSATEPSVLVRLCQDGDWDDVVMESKSLSSSDGTTTTTALLTAVRKQCPLYVARALWQIIRPEQIAAAHILFGSTILHQAIQHGCCNEVVLYLLDKMIEYSSDNDNKNTNLLGITDDLGRTVLHCWIERWQRFCETDITGNTAAVKSDITMWQIFEKLVAAYPDAVGIVDADRNTPLILLLATPRAGLADVSSALTITDTCNQRCWREEEIYRMVELMVSTESSIASTARKTPEKPRQWRFPHRFQQHHRQEKTGLLRLPQHKDQQQQDTTTMTTSARASIVSITPLFYALLNGRSAATIELLLQIHRKVGILNAGAMILSQHREVGLHIAVTVSADINVLQVLLKDHPASVVAQDSYGLTPLDWLWIRHVQDYSHSSNNNTTQHRQHIRQLISRRRYLSIRFSEWYHAASANCVPSLLNTVTAHNNCAPMSTNQTGPSQSTSTSTAQHNLTIHPEHILRLQDDLFHRLKLLLGAAASSTAHAAKEANGMSSSSSSSSSNDEQSWNLLHAACYVPIPLAMVRLVLAQDTNAVRLRDSRADRYPLHYAVERAVGYTASYMVGIILSRGGGGAGNMQTVQEPSPVYTILPLFPKACRAVDIHNQLPLHIAIDAFKKHRRSSSPSSSRSKRKNDNEAEESTVLDLLLLSYPASLHRRDGKTMLYPWQQAGVGLGSSLTTIYSLLRHQPTLSTGMTEVQ